MFRCLLVGVLSLFASGCLPCLATPDCIGRHTVKPVDDAGETVTSLTVRFVDTAGRMDEWRCPDESRAECGADGSIYIYNEGTLTVLDDQGRSAEISLDFGPIESCGCGSVFDDTLTVR